MIQPLPTVAAQYRTQRNGAATVGSGYSGILFLTKQNHLAQKYNSGSA